MTKKNSNSRISLSSSTPLLGMENIITTLTKIIFPAEPDQKKGKIIIIKGEPGSGKTRLAHELRHRSNEKNTRTFLYSAKKYPDRTLAPFTFTPKLKILAKNIFQDLSKMEFFPHDHFQWMNESFAKFYSNLKGEIKDKTLILIIDESENLDFFTLNFLKYIAKYINEIPFYIFLFIEKFNEEPKISLKLFQSHLHSNILDMSMPELSSENSKTLFSKILGETFSLENINNIITASAYNPLKIILLARYYRDSKQKSVRYLSTHGNLNFTSLLELFKISKLQKVILAQIYLLGPFSDYKNLLFLMYETLKLTDIEIKNSIDFLIKTGFVIEIRKNENIRLRLFHPIFGYLMLQKIPKIERILFNRSIAGILETQISVYNANSELFIYLTHCVNGTYFPANKELMAKGINYGFQTGLLNESYNLINEFIRNFKNEEVRYFLLQLSRIHVFFNQPALAFEAVTRGLAHCNLENNCTLWVAMFSMKIYLLYDLYHKDKALEMLKNTYLQLIKLKQVSKAQLILFVSLRKLANSGYGLPSWINIEKVESKNTIFKNYGIQSEYYRLLGIIYLNSGDFNQSIYCLNRCLDILGNRQVWEKNNIFLLLIRAYREKNDFKESIKNFKLLDTQFSMQYNRLFKIKALIELAKSQTRSEDLSSAEDTVKTIENLVSDLKCADDKADALMEAGSALLDIGSSLKAIDMYNCALKIYENCQNMKGRAIATLSLGRGYKIIGDYLKGIVFLKKALLSFKNLELKEMIVTCLLELGEIYGLLNYLSLSEKSFLEALKLSKHWEFLSLSAQIHFELARLYLNTGKIQIARKNLKTSKKIYNKISLRKFQDSLFLYETLVDKNVENTEKIIQTLSKILENKIHFIPYNLTGEILTKQAQMYCQLENYQEAFNHYLRASETYGKGGFFSLEGMLLEQALSLIKKQHFIPDRIVLENKLKKLTHFKNKFENNGFSRKAEILTTTITELAKLLADDKSFLNSSKPFRQANLSEETLQIESVSKIQPTINASIFINSLELFKDISKEFALSAPLPEFMKNTLKKVIEFMKPQNAYFAVINSSSGQIILEVCENFISPFNNKNMNNPEPELSRIVSEIVQTKKHQFLPDLTVDLRFKDIFKALNCKLSPIILNFFPINDQKSCLFILGFKSSEGDINFNPDYRIYFAETLSYYLGGIITHITTIPSKIINPEPSQLADVSILHDVKNLAEKNLIIEVLKKNSGNITKSAQDLGIARRQLQRLMKKLKLKREEFI